MSVYLQFGKDKGDILRHIEQVKSGKSNLRCPFCDIPLIAVKGTHKTHHFRHDGETCNESLSELEPIAGWSYFHLNYSKPIVRKLRDADLSNLSKRSKLYNTLNKSYRDSLFSDTSSSFPTFTPTDELLIIRRELPVLRFAYWMTNSLNNRLKRYRSDVKSRDKRLLDLRIEALRQYMIRTSTLYLFEHILSDNTVILKVGRTTRDINTRLKETTYELSCALDNQTVIKSQVIATVDSCGHLEKYLLYINNKHQFQAGKLTEYLCFEGAGKLPQKLVDDFKVLSGFSDSQKKLRQTDKKHAELGLKRKRTQEDWLLSKRWMYEHRRLEASKKTIAKIVADPTASFGRPKGSTLSTEDFLRKHNWVLSLLKRGMKQQLISDKTGASLSTIKRVKKIAKQNGLLG